MEKLFGKEVVEMLGGLHESNGVKVMCSQNLGALKYVGDSQGKVTKVVLEGGEEIETDMVVVGAGTELNVEMA